MSDHDVPAVAGPPRAGTLKACLEQSGLVLARMLRPGDRIDGHRVTSQSIAADGTVTIVADGLDPIVVPPPAP
jgi:hypothetical protein